MNTHLEKYFHSINKEKYHHCNETKKLFSDSLLRFLKVFFWHWIFYFYSSWNWRNWIMLLLKLKVRQFQNEFMKSSFVPKYERNMVRISALCSEGRNLDNFLFVFWEKWWLHKLILKLTDLYQAFHNLEKG